MHTVPVKSSNLKSIGYDADTQTLRVEFKSGGIWDYTGVPAEIHSQLLAAEESEDGSVGRTYHALVKGRFEGTKLEKEEKAA